MDWWLLLFFLFLLIMTSLNIANFKFWQAVTKLRISDHKFFILKLGIIDLPLLCECIGNEIITLMTAKMEIWRKWYLSSWYPAIKPGRALKTWLEGNSVKLCYYFIMLTCSETPYIVKYKKFQRSPAKEVLQKVH